MGGKFVTDEATQVVTKDVVHDFDALLKEFQVVVGDLMSKNPNNAKKITSIVEKYLGKGRKVNDCTEEQCEQIELILIDLKDLAQAKG